MRASLTFSGDTSAPRGAACPTARELQAMGLLAQELGRSDRVVLMNQIGRFLGVPPGGWHRQARLFRGDDLRVGDLLAEMARPRPAQLIAANLKQASRYVQTNLMLAMVTGQREASGSLTATGTRPVDTYHEGGLDHLGLLRHHLGLPRAVTGNWAPQPAFKNPETDTTVTPASIPARDQMIAYAAVLSASFSHNFKRSLNVEFGAHAQRALSTASRGALITWQAYTFLAPGGKPYRADEPLRVQLGKPFGHRSALGFFAHRARVDNRAPTLDDILSDHSLDQLEWIHSAKTRAAETVFLECLLKRVREILPG